MNKVVEDYLNIKAKEAADEEQKKKDALLLELGLYEKEYSPNGKYSPDYPLSEWDSENNTSKYYKKIPIVVSDDEYLEILKYQKTTAAEDEAKIKKTNTVSIIFKVLAWIVFVGGLLAGIVLGQTEVIDGYSTYTEFSFATALLYWAISFVSGMFFLGFAEIIQLLHDLRKKVLTRF